jgi:hypothetical protein
MKKGIERYIANGVEGAFVRPCLDGVPAERLIDQQNTGLVERIQRPVILAEHAAETAIHARVELVDPQPTQ